jgi:hypothetical protein
MRRDVANLKTALQQVQVEDAFLPVVAPCSISINYRSEYHKSEEEFLFAVADALHEEYKIIADAGLILQTDDAVLTNLHDAVVDSGREYRKWVGMNVAALNHALRGIPAEQVRYHLCWGSWPGPHTTGVPLAQIVDLVLQINGQAYSIEAANPRHEWVEGVGADTASRRQDPAAGDDQPQHGARGASGAGRSAHPPLRETRRAGERDSRQRLWFCARNGDGAAAPSDRPGQARGTRRGRADRDAAAAKIAQSFHWL